MRPLENALSVRSLVNQMRRDKLTFSLSPWLVHVRQRLYTTVHNINLPRFEIGSVFLLRRAHTRSSEPVTRASSDARLPSR
jgi:hypothetical protein